MTETNIIGSFLLLVVGLYLTLKIGSPSWNLPLTQDVKTFGIIFGVLAIHTGMYYMLPEYWVAWSEKNGFVFFQLLIALGLRIKSSGQKVMVVIGMSVAILSGMGLLRNAYSAYGDAQTLPEDTTAKTTVESFWRDNSTVPFSWQEQMIAIASKETQFNQFEDDGITPLRSKRKGYMCVMQLEEMRWMPQAEVLGQDYDMSTLEGCLKMSLWVRDKIGPEAWSENEVARSKANRKPIRVIAPIAPSWSEKIAVPGPFSIHEDGPIKVRTSTGLEIEIETGEKMDIGNTDYLEFQSRKEKGNGEMEVVNVTVSR